METAPLSLVDQFGKPLTVGPETFALEELSKADRSLLAYASPWAAEIPPPDLTNMRDFLGVYGQGQLANIAVHAAVRRIASDAAQIPLALHEKKVGRKPGDVIEEHPVLDLLDDINPSMTYEMFIQACVTYQLLAGNIFLGLEHPDEPLNAQALPTELWPLRPDHMFIIPDRTPENFGAIAGYKLKVGAVGVPYAADEIVHLHEFNPLNQYWGLPRLTVARLTLQQDYAQRKFNENFFRYGMHVSGVLSTDGRVVQSVFERLKQQINEQFTGLRNMFKLLILEQGLKFQEVQMTQQDAQFAEALHGNRKELVGMIFGLPPMAVGDYSDASVLANAEVQREERWLVALESIRFLAGGLNEYLLPRYEGGDKMMLVPDPSGIDVLQRKKLADEEQKSRVYITLTDAGWSPERARKRLYPEEDPFEETGPSPAEPEPVAQRKALAVPESIDPEIALKKTFLEDLLALEDLFIGKMKKGFRAWARKIMKNAEPAIAKLHEQFEAGEITRAKAAREMVKAMDLSALQKSLSIDLAPAYQQTAKNAIKFANLSLAGYGIEGVSFNEISPKIGRFLQKRGFALVKSIHSTVKEGALQQFIAGMNLGEGIPQLTKRLQSLITGYAGRGQRFRAERVARTEAAAATNEVALETYKSAGIKKKRWLDTRDNRQDSGNRDGICWQLGRMGPVDVEKDFMPGVKRPPDPHPMCRCAILPVVDDEDE